MAHKEVTTIASFIMFSVTERNGTIGTVKGSGESEVFHPKANFSLTIVEGSTDGYLARVTRASFNVSRYITILFIGQNQLLSLLMDYDY